MRRTNDAYYTPEWATRELVSNYAIEGKSILEPCVGLGNILDTLKELFPSYLHYSNDIDRDLEADYHFDLSYRSPWNNIPPVDWVISNPPFNAATEILKNAYDHAKLGVIFLLRLSFLEPTLDRQTFLTEHPPTSLIVLPRISLTGDGKTDSVTTAWMIWDKQESEGSITIIRKS